MAQNENPTAGVSADTPAMGVDLRERVRVLEAENAALRESKAAHQSLVDGTDDVTELGKTLEALRTSEVRYRRLFESAKDGILILDADTGMVVDVNPFLIDLLGYSREEILDRKVWELGFFRNLVANEANFEELKQKEYIRYDNMPLETATGKRIDVEFVSNVYLANNKKVIQCNIRDISEHKRAEKALHQSIERYDVVINTMHDGFWQWDSQGRLLDVNEAYCRLIGYPREQLTTMHIPEVEAAESPVETRQHIEKIMATGSDRFETRHRCADGRLVDLEVSAYFMPEHGGRLFAFFRDISERQRAVRELQESKHLVESIVENVPLMIFLKEAEDLRFVVFNKASEDLLGYDRKDLLGKNNLDLFPPEQAAHFMAQDREVLAGGVPLDIPEEPIQTARKGQRLLHTRKICIKGSDGHSKYLLGISEDITDKKRAEEEHTKLEQHLAQSRKLDAVGQLAGGVAHDFNNIMSVILSYADFLLDELPKGSPLAADAMEIKISGRRAADLTRQLLAFSRKQQVLPRSVDLNEAIIGISKMLGRLIGEHIECKYELGAGAGRVFIDPSQLESIIINLSVNARDAMEGGGVLTIATATEEIDASRAATLGVLAPGRFAVITVADTGTGMSEEVRGRIFEPFFTTKPQGKGTGLGLSTVYGAVTQNGGQIEVVSAPGKGTTFTVYLKCHADEDEARPEAAREQGAPCGGNILLVEDEDAVRRSTARMLRGAGYTVTEASNGEEAIAKYRETGACFALVITDMIMPGIGGLETAQQIRAMNPGQKVVYCSGYSDDMMTSQGRPGKGVVVIGKPVEKAGLLHKIREAIDG